MQCHLGDTASYLALLTDLAAAEKEIARAGASRRRDETARDLAELRRGDVIEVPTGRRAGLAVVLDPGVAADGSARPLVVTAGSWAGRLTVADFRGPVPALGRLRLGKYTDHRTPKVRRDVASALASSGIRPTGRGARREPVEEIDLTVLRKAIRAHPVHGCADRDEHVQWATALAPADRRERRAGRQGRQRHRLAGQGARRDHRPARPSAATCSGDRLTGDGKMLARIWSESDLVVAECLRRGHLGRPGSGRSGGRGVQPGLRIAAGVARHRPHPVRFGGPGPAGDHPGLGRDRRPGTGARLAPDPRSGCRVRRRRRDLVPRQHPRRGA